MDNRRLAGMMAILIGMSAIMAYFNAGNDTLIENWPLETYMNVASSVEKLTSVSTSLVYILTVGLFALIIMRLYKIGVWAYDQKMIGRE